MVVCKKFLFVTILSSVSVYLRIMWHAKIFKMACIQICICILGKKLIQIGSNTDTCVY